MRPDWPVPSLSRRHCVLGTWTQVLAELKHRNFKILPIDVPDVRVPGRWDR